MQLPFHTPLSVSRLKLLSPSFIWDKMTVNLHADSHTSQGEEEAGGFRAWLWIRTSGLSPACCLYTSNSESLGLSSTSCTFTKHSRCFWHVATRQVPEAVALCRGFPLSIYHTWDHGLLMCCSSANPQKGRLFSGQTQLQLGVFGSGAGCMLSNYLLRSVSISGL